jgi:probable phosphoglycerate mutase
VAEVTAHPAQEVWLVRHAETEWSRSGRHTGRTDVPLTDAGRERARELGARLAERSFAVVLTSPLERARETARLAGLGDACEVREDLLEWDYGDYEGITTPEIRKQRPDWYLWRDGVPRGETPAEVGARCDRVIDEITAVDGHVAIVAHGHILRALAARWLEQPVDLGGRLYLATGSLSVLGFEREVRVLRRWNAA